MQDAKELMPSNCGAGKDSWKSLEQQGDQIKMIQNLENKMESQINSFKAVNLKGDQPWMFTGRTDAKAESAPVFRLSDANRWLIGKVPDAGKDWRQRRGEHQRMRRLDGIINAVDLNLGKLREMVRDTEAWRAAFHGVSKCWMWLGDWTKTTM